MRISHRLTKLELLRTKLDADQANERFLHMTDKELDDFIGDSPVRFMSDEELDAIIAGVD